MKKNLVAQICAWNNVFCHFLRFGSLFFLKIAYSDTLQQCVTSSRGKIHEKRFWTQIWVESVKIGSKIKFFAIFLSLSVIFSIGQNDNSEQCLITSRGKTHKKKLGAQIWAKWPKIGPNIRFFVTFKFNSLVFLGIAYDDSLEHYPYKTLEKFLRPQICSYLQEVSLQNNCSIILYISANKANKVK